MSRLASFLGEYVTSDQFCFLNKINVFRLCKDLFDRINDDKSPDAQYSVEVRQ